MFSRIICRSCVRPSIIKSRGHTDTIKHHITQINRRTGFWQTSEQMQVYARTSIQCKENSTMIVITRLLLPAGTYVYTGPGHNRAATAYVLDHMICGAWTCDVITSDGSIEYIPGTKIVPPGGWEWYDPASCIGIYFTPIIGDLIQN